MFVCSELTCLKTIFCLNRLKFEKKPNWRRLCRNPLRWILIDLSEEKPQALEKQMKITKSKALDNELNERHKGHQTISEVYQCEWSQKNQVFSERNQQVLTPEELIDHYDSVSLNHTGKRLLDPKGHWDSNDAHMEGSRVSQQTSIWLTKWQRGQQKSAKNKCGLNW